MQCVSVLGRRIVSQRRGLRYSQLRLLGIRHSVIWTHRPSTIIQRGYSTGPTLLPRGFIFRIFWTGVTATIGYIYYQFNQASDWLAEQWNFVRELGIFSAMGFVEFWSDLNHAALELSSWNPFKWQKERVSGSHQAPTTSSDDIANKIRAADNCLNEGFDGGQECFRDFIKRMIEVRNILKSADMDTSLTLPSIVVIGSQSSGKSSVLESIVGHEFLPKGNNMVTRRPLELTLVNSSTCAKDYAIFPQLEIGPVYDFVEVQKRLMELNAAVPVDQWISPKPIELMIFSRNIPDLSLVDLPGYIQISNKSQPPILREKIAKLCEKYIERNNIILAVCPADVDLANAEALKAARAVDPHGQRTIGVLTKLDLVDADYAAEIIKNDDYPLRLGYVGVVCKPSETNTQPRALALLSRKNEKIDNTRYEDLFIKEHEQVFENVKDSLGVVCLRQKLTWALEASMAQSLSSVLARVREELTELKYVLKVEFNDRSISPEGYVSFLAGSVRMGLERVAREYNRAKVRVILQEILEDRLLSVSEDSIWNSCERDGSLSEPKLEIAVDQLTRSGIGRIVANGLVDAIITQAKNAIRDGPLSSHPAATEKLISQVDAAMRNRCQCAIEQIENAIKPLKHDLDYTNEEWMTARHKILSMFKRHEMEWDERIKHMQDEVGQKRLRKIVKRLSEVDDEIEIVSYSMNMAMVGKVKEIVKLTRKLKSLRNRISCLSTTACSQFSPGKTSKTNDGYGWLSSWFGYSGSKSTNAQALHNTNSCHCRCPEIYLYLVMEKLLSTATLHAHHELVYEFLNPFPNEIVTSFPSNSVPGLDKNDIMQFIQENSVIFRHYQLQERKRVLEQEFKKMFGHLRRHDDKKENDVKRLTHSSMQGVRSNNSSVQFSLVPGLDRTLSPHSSYLAKRSLHVLDFRQISSNFSLGQVISSSDIHSGVIKHDIKFLIFFSRIDKLMRWLQLEANPEVLTEYGRALGMHNEYRFADIIALDMETLRIAYGTKFINSCRAILVVVPIELLEKHCLPPSNGEFVFIKQTIDNACGVIALLHALINAGIASSPITAHIVSIGNPKARGEWLESNADITSIHEKFSALGNTCVPRVNEETNYHFIAVVRTGNDVICLDGRKEAPALIGSCSAENDFMSLALEFITSLCNDILDLSIAALALGQR